MKSMSAAPAVLPGAEARARSAVEAFKEAPETPLIRVVFTGDCGRLTLRMHTMPGVKPSFNTAMKMKATPENREAIACALESLANLVRKTG